MRINLYQAGHQYLILIRRIAATPSPLGAGDAGAKYRGTRPGLAMICDPFESTRFLLRCRYTSSAIRLFLCRFQKFRTSVGEMLSQTLIGTWLRG